MEWEEESLGQNPNHLFRVTRYGPDGEDEFQDLTQECTKEQVLRQIFIAHCEG